LARWPNQEEMSSCEVEKICKSKTKGGLGVKDLRRMNISLLCKWLWNLENDEGLWQDIVILKYVKSSPISLIHHRHDDSPIRRDLLQVKPIYLQGREIQIQSGGNVSFWYDKWLEDIPLCQYYPVLHELCWNQ
jgi:hypothetical protein